MTDDQSRLKKGNAILKELLGFDADNINDRELGPAFKLAPDMTKNIAEFCFGGYWARPNLALRDRSLVCVSQLAALGRTTELKIHLKGALNAGISREELIEVLMQTSQYAGLPTALDALSAAAEVLGTEAE